MKNTLRLSFLYLLIIFSCKAQQNYPLNTLDQIPNGSYIIDYNNELDQFVGNYYAEFQGRKTFLTITKEVKKLMNYPKGEYYYKDLIWVRYKVTDLTDNILQTTLNNNDIKNKGIYDMYLDRLNNELYMHYTGTNCGIGWGRVQIKKVSSTQILWSYYPDSSVIDSNTCPPGQDLKVYLPETADLIFTKL